MPILVIEDDRHIADILLYNLQKENYVVDICRNGIDGLNKARRSPPDLIILDLMLPGMNGLDLCRELKRDRITHAIPILILTAKGDEVDKIVGFEMGADDYMSKPFSPRELILRVKAILRRSQPTPAQPPIQIGSCHIDPDRFSVTMDGETIVLTATEFKLLYHLMSTKGRVATRDQLLDVVWGYDAALTTRTVDTHIKRLRQKLKQAERYIETIRGIGYRFILPSE